MSTSTWTKEDSAKMDAAAYEAEQDLKTKLANQPNGGSTFTASQLLDWWNKWLMKAGHKRLYRIATRLLP